MGAVVGGPRTPRQPSWVPSDSGAFGGRWAEDPTKPNGRRPVWQTDQHRHGKQEELSHGTPTLLTNHAAIRSGMRCGARTRLPTTDPAAGAIRISRRTGNRCGGPTRNITANWAMARPRPTNHATNGSSGGPTRRISASETATGNPVVVRPPDWPTSPAPAATADRQHPDGGPSSTSSANRVMVRTPHRSTTPATDA